MSKQKAPFSSGQFDKNKPASLDDLIVLVMEPLAAQIDRGRLEIHERIQELHSMIENSTTEILQKIQALEDSVQILARQKARDLQEKPENDN